MSKTFYRLNSISVLDIAGADAEKIIHNLTTNEIKSLEVGYGCESFVTDVKGKTLGHVYVYRLKDCFRLIGAGGQSDQIAAHADRYTIVEDCTPSVRDAEHVGFVLPPDSAPAFGRSDSDNPFVESSVDNAAFAYGVLWLGKGTRIVLAPVDDAAQAQQQLEELGLQLQDEDHFHQQRTVAGFPWYRVDFGDKNLPQEVDRNAAAISFTKGCYLGQETVARLDAMGQVQKKLIRWSIHGGVPAVDTELIADEKTVARLTSVTQTSENEAVAIAMTRRSHFDADQKATAIIEDGRVITATVL